MTEHYRHILGKMLLKGINTAKLLPRMTMNVPQIKLASVYLTDIALLCDSYSINGLVEKRLYAKDALVGGRSYTITILSFPPCVMSVDTICDESCTLRLFC